MFTLERPGHPSVPVYYVTGERPSATATILIVMHGVERNAAEYRDAWADLARDRDMIVVAPEFSDDDFPGSAEYNLGGLASGGVLDGAYGYIEDLFHETRRLAGGEQTGYEMFGHSAGAQFVHRFVMFAPRAAVTVAVAANAGWYTMPDDDADFPFGLGGSDAPDFSGRRAFDRELVVLLGTDDTGTENLRQDAGADAQGETRLERGHAFFERASDAAARDGVELRWQLVEVPGVDHDKERMARAALPFLCSGDESCATG